MEAMPFFIEGKEDVRPKGDTDSCTSSALSRTKADGLSGSPGQLETDLELNAIGV